MTEPVPSPGSPEERPVATPSKPMTLAGCGQLFLGCVGGGVGTVVVAVLLANLARTGAHVSWLPWIVTIAVSLAAVIGIWRVYADRPIQLLQGALIGASLALLLTGACGWLLNTGL